MHVRELYIGFWPPSGERWTAWFGHVEIWGYTKDNTWFFLDPTAKGLKIEVAHLHDEVEELLTRRFTQCSEIWRTERIREFRQPVFAPYHCVSFVGHALGIRAFTVGGLKRRLPQIQAERIYENPKGRP